MSTFLILPSRPKTGARMMELLAPLVPAGTWRKENWTGLARLLEEAIESEGRVIPVFADDLCNEATIEAELQGYFGAEPEDEILSCLPGLSTSPTSLKRAA